MFMTLTEIYFTFKNLPTVSEKIRFLHTLSLSNYHYHINYDNLIRTWETLIAD